MENAEAIAAVDGVDMVMVGTADLSATMGVPGALGSPKSGEPVSRLRRPVERVARFLPLAA